MIRQSTRPVSPRMPWRWRALAILEACGFILSVLCGGSAAAQTANSEAPKRFFERPLSGLSFTSEEVRRMQADELGNPAMLLVDDARRLWTQRPASGNDAGLAGRSGPGSCADCHGPVESMKGVATRYPKVLDDLGLLNLEARINACRTGRQAAPAWTWESPALLGMTALVGMQSRGQSSQVSIDGPARDHFEAGRALYYQRMGQMNLSCAHCHEKNAGRRLLAEVISQGQGNAYPIYRLEWQATGSLHRRFRSCLNGVRAQLWPQGAPEFLNLELFLAWRSKGLPVETPGVRR